MYNALQDDDPYPTLSDTWIIALTLLHLHRQDRCTHEEIVKRFFDSVFYSYPGIEELLDRIIPDPHVPDLLPPELLTDLQFAVLRWGGLRGVLVIPNTFVHPTVDQEALWAPLTSACIRTL